MVSEEVYCNRHQRYHCKDFDTATRRAVIIQIQHVIKFVPRHRPS